MATVNTYAVPGSVPELIVQQSGDAPNGPGIRGVVLVDSSGSPYAASTSGSTGGLGTSLSVDTPVFLVIGQTRTKITCTSGSTDYAAGAAIPAGTKRILIRSITNDAVVANEVTTATNGIYLKSDIVYEFRVTPGDTIHAQSDTAGTVVAISYLKT